jgi:hypothetical protein
MKFFTYMWYRLAGLTRKSRDDVTLEEIPLIDM